MSTDTHEKTATQVARPWRATARTVFQVLVALASMWGLIVAALGLPDWAWVSTSLAVAAGITRVMALPGVEEFLNQWFPWLAANPAPRVVTPSEDGAYDVSSLPPTDAPDR